MKALLRGGRVWHTDGSFAEDCPVIWENGIILAVGEGCQRFTADQTVDACGKTVLPGLVDVHTHGRAGYDFSTATADEMRVMKTD